MPIVCINYNEIDFAIFNAHTVLLPPEQGWSVDQPEKWVIKQKCVHDPLVHNAFEYAYMYKYVFIHTKLQYVFFMRVLAHIESNEACITVSLLYVVLCVGYIIILNT